MTRTLLKHTKPFILSILVIIASMLSLPSYAIDYNYQNCPAWAVGTRYDTNQCVWYSNAFYSVLAAHTAQSDWTPHKAPTLWQLQPAAGTAPSCADYREGLVYSLHQKVVYKGTTYRAIQAHTAYPGAEWYPNKSPTLWQKDPVTCQTETWDRGSTLKGTDANNNGIRDDIDAWIRRNFSDPKEIKAVEQAAKSLQSMILVNKTDRFALKEVSIAGGKSIHCLHSIFQGGRQSEVALFLESMTSNTKERLQAYLNYNKARNGTTSTAPRGDTCEK
jgi:hypothetical protein